MSTRHLSSSIDSIFLAGNARKSSSRRKQVGSAIKHHLLYVNSTATLQNMSPSPLPRMTQADVPRLRRRQDDGTAPLAPRLKNLCKRLFEQGENAMDQEENIPVLPAYRRSTSNNYNSAFPPHEDICVDSQPSKKKKPRIALLRKNVDSSTGNRTVSSTAQVSFQISSSVSGCQLNSSNNTTDEILCSNKAAANNDSLAKLAFPSLSPPANDARISSTSCSTATAPRIRKVSSISTEEDSYGWFVAMDAQAEDNDKDCEFSRMNSGHPCFDTTTATSSVKTIRTVSGYAFSAPITPNGASPIPYGGNNHDAQQEEVEWAQAADTVDDVLGDSVFWSFA